MLREDDVVDAICEWLVGRGWVIVSRALATQRGDDIIAERGGRILRVEAKGGGSSKEGTRRFGKEFTLGQCQVSVGMAILRALRFVSEGETEGAVALPNTGNFRRVVEPVLPAVERAGIAVLLVDERGQVEALLPADI